MRILFKSPLSYLNEILLKGGKYCRNPWIKKSSCFHICHVRMANRYHQRIDNKMPITFPQFFIKDILPCNHFGFYHFGLYTFCFDCYVGKPCLPNQKFFPSNINLKISVKNLKLDLLPYNNVNFESYKFWNLQILNRINFAMKYSNLEIINFEPGLSLHGTLNTPTKTWKFYLFFRLSFSLFFNLYPIFPNCPLFLSFSTLREHPPPPRFPVSSLFQIEKNNPAWYSVALVMLAYHMIEFRK